MDVAKLREIVEPNRDSKASRIFDLTMLTFILVALVTFTLDTMPAGALPDWAEQTLSVIELITVIVFTVEYVLRLIAAERKLRFVFSFYGIVDLLAILPFYLGLFGGRTVDLRSLRILRLFRVFRVFKLLRYSRAIHHFGNALREVREELILYLMATAFLMFLAATGIYYFEHEVNENFKSIFHSLWWAVVTLTTVGYGDVYPMTIGGKIFTGFLLIIGLGVISVPSGLIASGLTQARIKEREAKRKSE
ncbi:MAG: ion transporter [Planctomycetes bacterium]|nr:ion transporter [Planctomycetota bacterium]